MTDARAALFRQVRTGRLGWQDGVGVERVASACQIGDLLGGLEFGRYIMDADEPLAAKAGQIVIGEDLSALAIAELEVRVEELKREIVRVEAEAEKKRVHTSAAAALFKS